MAFGSGVTPRLALHEQGAGSGAGLTFSGTAVRRDLQRAHGVAVLGVELQGLAAGREHAQPRTGSQEVIYERSGREQVLEVVEYQDSTLGAEEALNGRHRCFASHGDHVQRLGDGGRDVLGLRRRCEWDQPAAVRILGLQLQCHVQSQPRLPDPARTGERYEAVVLLVK